MNNLDMELQRIWRKAIRDRWTANKLKLELNKITSPFYTKVYMQDAIKNAIPEYESFEWFKENVSSSEDTKIYNDIFKRNYKTYAQQKEGLNRDIIQVFENGITNDLPDSTIISELEMKMGKWAGHAQTVTNTAQQQLSMLQFKITAEEAGVEKFRYSGPPPQRPICRHYYQKELTIKEINEISARLGYDFFIERGLWNCRHFWEVVV